MTSEEILTYFYETFSFKKQKDGWVVSLDLNKFKYKNLPFNLVDPVSKDVVAYKDVKLSLKLLKEIQDKKINKFEIPTGNPLVVEFDNKLDIKEYFYLDETRAKSIIFNQ